MQVYELNSLFDRLNRLYFDSQLKLIVRWSHRSPPKASRSIVLGTYNDKTKCITMSRRLNSTLVPLYVVECVLFHEMLHAVFPREEHRMHTEKFNKFERMHPDFERARKWEKESIKLLFEKPQKALPFVS